MDYGKQAPGAINGPAWSIWLRRAAGGVLLAAFVGWASGAAMRADARIASPAGFGRGLLHGAMMPMAWPTLLFGRDQEIYAKPNSGRTYKLGYSMGVNVCGAAFFGWSFSRWRRWSAAPASPQRKSER